MEATAIAAVLQDVLPNAHLEVAPSVDLHATLIVGQDHLLDALRTLRDHPDLKFALLSEITAVDYLPREPRYEVIYILVSLAHRHRLRLKVRLPADDPHVPTATTVWPGANWLEREVWDLFGIAFDGHPDPRRLLMPEDWDGHPLRKDYPVQLRMTPETTQPVQVTEEEFRANMMKDRLARS
jgi:NADH-quinone oxidoreductase subunit C